MAIPATMTAVLLIGHGGYDMLEVRTDHPTPVPGPGEVLVRVGACGLNNTDINTRTAWYSEAVEEGVTPDAATGGYADAATADGSWSGATLRFPRIQGADVAGRVAAVGPGGDEARLGERVLVDPWLLDPADPADFGSARYLGSEVDGGYAEYCAVPAGNAHRIESQLTDAELATFPCAASTAENLLRRASVGSGDTVVVTGASGGVGTAAVQLCRALGATPIAVASPPKAEQLIGLGAESVIDRNEPDLAIAIEDAASGRVDVVADVVGGAMFEPLISTLCRGGRYTTSGAISGPIVELDLRDLIYRDLSFTGATICPPGTFARVVAHIEAGELRPVLGGTWSLTDLVEAQKAFVAKRHVGNIVVEVPR